MTGVEFLRHAIAQMQGHSYRTYKELAARAGISAGNLSSFMKEGGSKKDMNLNTAWRLFEALGIVMPTLPSDASVEKSNTSNPKNNVIERLTTENIELKARLDQCELMNDRFLHLLSHLKASEAMRRNCSIFPPDTKNTA